MADPITIGALAATALSMAAEAMLKGAVGEAVKDAYKGLKTTVAHWAGNDLEALEKNPTSKARQGVIAEEIDRQPSTEQETAKALATALIEALKKEGISDPRTSVTVTAKNGGVAAGGDIQGSTITTNTGVKQ